MVRDGYLAGQDHSSLRVLTCYSRRAADLLWGVGKYASLREYLRRRPSGVQTVTFDQLNELVPGGLPPSSHSIQRGGRTRTMGAMFTLAHGSRGWQAAGVNPRGRGVTFRRSTS